MRNLIALLLLALLAAPFFSFSQIPGYLSENGLAAFYPLDSNWQDLSVHGNHAINYGATAGLDRNGDEFGSMHFDGQSWLEIPHSESVGMDHGDSLTWSVWIRFDNIDVPQNIFEKWNDASSTPYSQLMLRANGSYSGQYLHTMAYCGVGFENEGRCNATNQEDFQAGWFHALMRTNGQSSEFFINGYLVDSRFHCSEGCGNTSPLYLGARNATNPQKFFGQLDEFAVWSRYLTDEEIANLAFSGEPVIGCTDPVACNYMEQANFDDGSCYSCSIPSGHCGTGTFWDAESQLCVVANPTDADLDGCTGVGDILEVLSTFGQCYTAVDTNWICGDPLTYWDLNYATVLIGDQCWFAENLRTLQRSNGQSLSHNNPTIYNGPMDPAIYNDPSQAGVVDPNYDASLVNEYGRFYNGAAAFLPLDSGGICPSGWRVPCRVDFEELWTNTYALNDPLINASQGCSCDNTGMWSTDAVSFGNLEDSCALAEEYLEMESLSIAESCSDWYYYGYQDSSTCVEEELALNAANFDFSLWYGTEWYCPNNSSIRSGFNAKPVGIMVPTNDEPWVYVGENAWFYCAGTICDSGDHVTILFPESYVGHGGSNYWPIRCIKNE